MKSILFPGKFLLGYGLLETIGTYSKPLGKKFLVLASKSVMEISKAKVGKSFDSTEMTADYVLFGGECSYNEINRLTAIGNGNGNDCVIAIGGGKLLDAGKAVAHKMGVPVMVVPTIASTDAPSSALSVIYTDDGVFEEYFWLPANPNVVIADTEILGKAPVRYLVSGMGDAFATYFEARAVRTTDSNTCAVSALGKQTLTAFALAELALETLYADGLKAKLSVEVGAITPAVENIIEANILLSGIGFESGGLSAAHSVHNGLTVLAETHVAHHGEKVAFGVLAQLALENAPMGEIVEVMDFYSLVGLPVTLKEIGLDNPTNEDLWKVANATAMEGETIHTQPGEITADKIFAAIKAADAYGTAYIAGK
jgi:glycerol dehydrogenase